jgi:hypothetical protein
MRIVEELRRLASAMEPDPAYEEVDPDSALLHAAANELEGLAKDVRDEFAIAALPSVYANTVRICEETGWPEDWRLGVAMDAYAMADAMIKARSINADKA